MESVQHSYEALRTFPLRIRHDFRSSSTVVDLHRYSITIDLECESACICDESPSAVLLEHVSGHHH